ncbi:hypothetical protein [Streptomyces sp. R41]|uniref:Transposase InsH N-terminal domain-containing protein n=1 Tax=Streptomyces sp. R41 TaxID=3238632 RepID=A0AB39R3U1_9ACTN
MPDALHCMVVVDRVDCDHAGAVYDAFAAYRALRTFREIGDTSPLHATATGQAILTHLTATEAGRRAAARHRTVLPVPDRTRTGHRGGPRGARCDGGAAPAGHDRRPARHRTGTARYL